MRIAILVFDGLTALDAIGPYERRGGLGRHRHGTHAGSSHCRGGREAIQLGIEYDPAPPFDTGSPEKAPPALVDAVKQAESD